MARYLAYTSPARGHLYPIVDTLLELRRRGHEIHLRTLASEVPALRELGLHAGPIKKEIETVTLDTWKGNSPQEGLAEALKALEKRSSYEMPDLQAAVAEVDPDSLIVDITTVGAAAVAEASALPWAQTVPLFQWATFPGVDPAKLTLTPFGLTPSGMELVNARRREAGLAPAEGQSHYPADLYLYYTSPPLEPGTPLPTSFRMVGPGTWDPAAETPAWYMALDDPVIVVSSSSEFQGDDALVRTSLEALAGEDVRVVVTTAAHDPAGFEPPANARVVRNLSHKPLLDRAACVVCHGGMGIVQKALAAGVPLCVVPFGRDQFDVAARVASIGAGTMILPWDLTAGSLRAAVREAMTMKASAEAVAAEFSRSGGPQAAADALETLLTVVEQARIGCGGLSMEAVVTQSSGDS
ncbi:MAG: glycosyltransferase [Actinomycetota bacterium]|nr:glycosyltransferase [Actinomycetota bacterium]